MYKKRLFILIEGDDDKDLFEKVIKPIFKKKYDPVVLWKYSQKTKDEVNIFLRIIKEKWNANYIFVADNDKLRCVPGRKEEIQEEFEVIDDKGKIMLVIRKIESWYLAGLDDDACKRFGFSPFKNTDKFGKGKFKVLRRKRFKSEEDFKREILNSFDIETAKRKNKSFEYFFKKYICEA